MSDTLQKRKVEAHKTKYRFVEIPDWTPEAGEEVKMTSGKVLTCYCGWTRWHKDEWSGDRFCLSCGRRH